MINREVNMNNFTLDDIEDLVISGRGRLDPTGEYDISYYENYINENINIIGELIKNIQNQMTLIKDEKIRIRLLMRLKDLTRTYEENQSKRPRIEYENSPFSTSHGRGYLQTHKYAEFIEEDFRHLVRSYSNIIRFMNNVYENFIISEKNGEMDSNILYGIFSTTKKACSTLGIHCPDASSLCDSISGDPYAEKSELLEMDFEIFSDNSLPHDIMITSLPYTVTAPTFTWEGHGKYEMPVTNPRPKILYNKSYLQEPTI